MLTIASRLDVMNRLGRAMADPTRSRILMSLLDGPSHPAVLSRELGLTRSNVSNHLTCLRDCGIVVAEPEGRQTRYEIADPHLAAALTALIFPGILNTDPARPWIGIAGGIAAALLAWRRCPVLVCVLTAAVVGFASISLCRLIIRKFGLKIFAFYTGALGLILIARQLLAG